MKIGSHPDPLLTSTATAKATGAASAVPATTALTGQRPPGVAVSVSSQARALGGAAAASSANDIDHAKVEAFRTAIAQGTFAPNPEAIADKLLANAKEMLDRVQR